MRKPCLLVAVLLPLVAAGARPPAAVFEDVFELGRPNAAFRATADSHSGMKAYLRKKKYRQLRDPVPQASTMAAYTAAHERYQSLEEKRNDRIRMENLRQLASATSVRTKRLEPQPSARPQLRSKQPKRIDIVPREVFKFELSDAMISAHPLEVQDQPTGDASKARTKRSERVEPVPREIFRFELGDAMVARRHGAKSLNTSAPATAAATPPLHSRHRRSANADPRDYVKFELEDGRTPEGYRGARGRQTTSSTQQPQSPTSTAKPPASTRTPENLRHPFTSSDSYRRGKVFDEIVERPGRRRAVPRKEKRDSGTQEAQVEEAEPEEQPVADMSPEESRRVRVRGRKPKQIANYEDLPPSVQKAIDIAIKENERMNGAMMTVVAAGETGSVAVASSTPSTGSYQFGDKKPKTKKPYSATTTKITEPKFVPSAKLSETRLPAVEEESNGQSGFLPSLGAPVTGAPESATSKQAPNTLPGIPKAWWSYSDLRRPKRLYHKAAYQPHHHQAPLGVVSPQYVNTFKPLVQQGPEPSGSGNELSGGYQRRPALFTPTSAPGAGRTTSSEVGYGPVDEVYIKERPKIQYVIKEIPVQVKQPRTKITVQPSISISYDKDVTGPGTGPAEGGHRGYDNPYGPIELQYEPPAVSKEPPKSFQNMKIVVPDPHDDSREQKYQQQQQQQEQEQYQFESYKSSNEIDTTGSSIAALSALIGQRPSVQLHGLNELLHMPVPMGGQHSQRRPQDSTAPITFPESSTPAAPTPKSSRPGYRSVQIDHGPKILYEDDSLYRTVQMNPQLQVPTGKEYTPIKELVADVADSDLIGPTIAPPTHATYVIGTGRKPSTPAPIVEHHGEFNEEEAGHESNAYRHVNVHSTPSPLALDDGLASHRYQEQHHHHHHHHHHDGGGSDEHYDDSEGYAFGYRVRDFHTGNDFGHVQNHDNGVTRGEYHILLPDGRVQNVRYMADEQGFHADVTYESVHQPHQAQ